MISHNSTRCACLGCVVAMSVTKELLPNESVTSAIQLDLQHVKSVSHVCDVGMFYVTSVHIWREFILTT